MAEVWWSRELVAQTFKQRSSYSQDDKDDLVEVAHELKDVIICMYSMKSMFIVE